MFIFFHNGEDIDVAFRRLAQKWYKVIKLPILLNKFSALIPVETILCIENGKWSLRYEADNNIFAWSYIPIYKTWPYFNSFDRPNLPSKEFKEWEVEVKETESLFNKIKFYFFDKRKILTYKLVNIKNRIFYKLYIKKLRQRIMNNIKDGKYFNND